MSLAGLVLALSMSVVSPELLQTVDAPVARDCIAELNEMVAAAADRDAAAAQVARLDAQIAANARQQRVVERSTRGPANLPGYVAEATRMLIELQKEAGRLAGLRETAAASLAYLTAAAAAAEQDLSECLAGT